jgi:hypothetical protein
MLDALIRSTFNFINHNGVYNKVLRFILANSHTLTVIYHFLSIVRATMFPRASIVQDNVISDLELRF